MKYAVLPPALGLAVALGIALVVVERGDGRGGGPAPTVRGSASPARDPREPSLPVGSPEPVRARVAPSPPIRPEPGATRSLEVLLAEAGVDEDDGGAATPAELRLRLVRAIRGTFGTDAEKQVAMRAALSSSGARADWNGKAAATFAPWALGLGGDAAVQSDTVRCFQAGCEVRVVFPSRVAFERAAARFRTLHEEDPWHGGRALTPPEPGDGESLSAYWMVLAPDPGE
ncbi:MAG: hypothetical protein FJ104_09275 [Deltaproteobacteria bacterium]|nr:hypothetical protein [Deltaproteobacteria bacterium]